MKVALRIDYNKYLVVHPAQVANLMAVLTSATVYEGSYTADDVIKTDKTPEVKMIHEDNLLDAQLPVEVTEGV